MESLLRGLRGAVHHEHVTPGEHSAWWRLRAIFGIARVKSLTTIYVVCPSVRCSADTDAAPRGIATTLLNSGQQWDAPNGWAPLQWVAVVGLRRYHQDASAEQVGRRFLGRVQVVFDQARKLTEKYDVDTPGHTGAGGGEYLNQDGFGWTNGVTLRLLDLYPPQPVVSHCFVMPVNRQD